MLLQKITRREGFSQSLNRENSFIAVCVSLAVWVFFVAYRCLYIHFVEQTGVIESLGILFSTATSILLWTLLLLALLLLAFVYLFRSKQINDFLYKWRWPLAGILLALLVIFELSGSSLAMWGTVLPNGSAEGLLLGLPRGIRTDEWATSLPMTFAQFNDFSGYLPYFGEVFRATSTDMFIVSGQPVADPALLFRPLNWGYLFLGMAKGLSFVWGVRLIALFMLTFEIGMLLFKQSKPLSIAFALFVAFSPVISWWGSGELILYAEALMLLCIVFFKAQKRWQKTGIALAFFILLGAYTLVLYPAWQVPFAILFLIIGISYLMSIKESVHFSAKRDLICLAPGLLIFALGMFYVWSMSADTIQAVSSTSYPGQRTEFGGNVFDWFFRYPSALFTPLMYEGLSVERADAISMYFDFFPLGLVLAGYVMIIQKRRNFLLMPLLIFYVIILVYCTVGFPEWLARITLLSFSTPERMAVVASFINVLLLFYSVSLLKETKRRAVVIGISLLYAGAMTFAAWVVEPGYIGLMKGTVLVLLLATAAIAFMMKKTNWILAFSLVIALFAGVLVNPFQLGIAPVQNNQLIQDIRSIKDTSDAKWVSATDWAENTTALAGASTINTTQVYPNFAMWEILDPDGGDRDIYNRFAHLNFSIEDIPEAHISLSSNDVIRVEVPVKQLEQLDVGFVLSLKALDKLNGNDYGVHFILINRYEDYYLYEVEYRK